MTIIERIRFSDVLETAKLELNNYVGSKQNNMEENWVITFRAQGQTEGYIIKGKLESNGIPVRLKQEAIGKIYGLTLNGLGEVKVMVPETYEDKAEKILEESK